MTPEHIRVLDVVVCADKAVDGYWSFTDEQRDVCVTDPYGGSGWSITYTLGSEDGPFVGTFEGTGATLDEAIANLLSHMRALALRIVAIDPTVCAGDVTTAKQALEVLNHPAVR